MGGSTNGKLRLGAHMSTEGGLYRAVERAEEVSATALQIFVKSARQWTPPPLKPDQVDLFRQALDASGLAPYTMAHASYLINLAAPVELTRERSMQALAEEVQRCDTLGVPYLVLHPGSHVASGEQQGLERIAEALGELLPAKPRRGLSGGVTVLLENTAGQGSNLGYRFAHLGWLLREAPCKNRLGVCFDTCHALAAGYELRTEEGYQATFDEFEREIGLDHLLAFHLNDSKHPLGSRKDRHEHIGEGEIGEAGFRRLMTDSRFRGRPMVLETPKGKTHAEDLRNLGILRGLAGEAPA